MRQLAAAWCLCGYYYIIQLKNCGTFGSNSSGPEPHIGTHTQVILERDSHILYGRL